jgi:hypothetical protein
MVRRGIAVAVLAGALAAPALAAPGTPNLVRLLAGPIASARAHGAQVLVPSTIETTVPHLYGAGGATANGYDIELGAAPNCADANACFVAEFTAASGQPVAGATIALAHGLRGRYSASACGASCNPAAIRWTEYGARYTIKYTGSRPQLVALADSAISAGPR